MSRNESYEISSIFVQGPSYQSNDKDLKSDQCFFILIKKIVLLKKFYGEIFDINDENKLDKIINDNKNDLNWDLFLRYLHLRYNNDMIYEEVLSKVLSYPTINYSQIFQMKQYFDSKYIKFIMNNLSDEYNFIYSNTFFSYANDFQEKINSREDVLKCVDSFLNLPYDTLNNYVSSYEKDLFDSGRTFLMALQRKFIPRNDKDYCNLYKEGMRKMI